MAHVSIDLYTLDLRARSEHTYFRNHLPSRRRAYFRLPGSFRNFAPKVRIFSLTTPVCFRLSSTFEDVRSLSLFSHTISKVQSQYRTTYHKPTARSHTASAVTADIATYLGTPASSRATAKASETAEMRASSLTLTARAMVTATCKTREEEIGHQPGRGLGQRCGILLQG